VVQTTLVNPVLGITKMHTGNFSPRQSGATYTVTVSNLAGAAATSGTVTVTETVPSGLTLVSMRFAMELQRRFLQSERFAGGRGELFPD
jgi:hypothetical protein